MKFKRYMLEFERFNPDNLAEVLALRNAHFVRERMTYTAEILMEDHLKWFEAIDNNRNFYFLVRLEREAIGVINIKDYDPAGNKAELGIFFGKEKIINSIYPIICAFTLQDLACLLLDIKDPFTKVKKRQIDISKFNDILGFEQETEFNDYDIYRLVKEKACSLTKKYRKAALALSGDMIDPDIFFFEFDEQDEKNNRKSFIMNCYERLHDDLKRLFVMQ